jgi:hypothetical protein
MERFFAHGCRGKALLQLNSCRQHLHALRISEFSSADGRHLSDAATEVQLDPHRSSSCSWPRTHRPKFGTRSLWRSALTKVFVRPVTSQELAQPLLPFIASTNSSWLWRCPPSDQRLFAPAGPTWDFCHVRAGRRRSLNRLHQLGGSVPVLSTDASAATVSLHCPQARLLSHGILAPSASPQPLSLSFSQTIEALPPDSKWAIQEHALPSDLRPIIASLHLGTARAISDGSFKNKFGTSAFTVLDTFDCSVLGLNIVPGHPDDQGAYRSG